MTTSTTTKPAPTPTGVHMPTTALCIDMIRADASGYSTFQCVLAMRPDLTKDAGSSTDSDTRVVTYITRIVKSTDPDKKWSPFVGTYGALVGTNENGATVSTALKGHYLRALVVGNMYAVDITPAEVRELADGEHSTALFDRMDRARKLHSWSLEKPQDDLKEMSSDVLIRKVGEWADDPKAFVPVEPRASEAAMRDEGQDGDAAAPVGRALPDDAIRPGDKVIVPATGMPYIARKIHGDLSDVQMLRTARGDEIPALLKSLPGTGKTAAVMAAFGDELVTVVCTSETEVSDFVGTYVPTAEVGKFLWVDGPLIRAMEEGKPLLVDEIALCDPRALSVLYSAMDGRGEVVVTANPDRGTVVAQPGFFVVGACNPDVPGARMSDAMLSRFPLQVNFTTDFAAMPELGIPRDVITVCETLDGKRTKNKIATSPQMREALAWVKAAHVFSPDVAWAALLSSIPPADYDAVRDLVERITGMDLKQMTTG